MRVKGERISSRRPSSSCSNFQLVWTKTELELEPERERSHKLASQPASQPLLLQLLPDPLHADTTTSTLIGHRAAFYLPPFFLRSFLPPPLVYCHFYPNPFELNTQPTNTHRTSLVEDSSTIQPASLLVTTSFRSGATKQQKRKHWEPNFGAGQSEPKAYSTYTLSQSYWG